MKLTLLCNFLFLFFNGNAASIQNPDPGGPGVKEISPEIITHSLHGFRRTSKKGKYFYYRGRGTMGLLLGLFLGPVGYLCVHLCSHNKTMIDKAGEGALIWTFTALLSGLVLAAVASRESVAQIAWDVIIGILQNSN